jgi:hypothetical protein
MSDQTKVDTGTEVINEVLEGLQQDLIVPIGRAYSLLESLAAERDTLQAQLAEARAVVERYTKITRDGARVGPGDTIYTIEYLGAPDVQKWQVSMGFGYESEECPSKGFFTREAAEAARDEKGGGDNTEQGGRE